MGKGLKIENLVESSLNSKEMPRKTNTVFLAICYAAPSASPAPSASSAASHLPASPGPIHLLLSPRLPLTGLSIS